MTDFDRMQAATQLRELAGLPLAIPLRSIAAVLERAGDDVDLALTALVLDPRPPWVAELLGVHRDRPLRM